MKETAFKVRDKVTWTSQSHGGIKKKTGKVVEIIEAGGLAPIWRIENCGLRRDHKSYVVQVGNKYYWPRVNYLKKVK